ncbi:MAG: hypothetical protein K2M82_01045 [Lachnospiraceae bacterium]|nr:hypothetical protein [Lachnospiraceae bacterium]
MLKKETSQLVERLVFLEKEVERALEVHLSEYSDYGMDDIANDLISIQASLEVVRLKVQYAMIKESEQE